MTPTRRSSRRTAIRSSLRSSQRRAPPAAEEEAREGDELLRENPAERVDRPVERDSRVLLALVTDALHEERDRHAGEGDARERPLHRAQVRHERKRGADEARNREQMKPEAHL